MAGPIILLKLSGRDQGEAMVALLRLLDQFGTRVLDIGRAEIHGESSLGMLLLLADAASADALSIAATALLGGSANASLSLSELTPEQYQAWAAGQGQSRYIVTLLARQLFARQLLRITNVVQLHGLVIRRITRLSGRPMLNARAGDEQAIVEFELRAAGPGTTDLRRDPRGTTGERGVDQQALRRALLDTLRPLDVDVSVQMDDADRRNRRLVAFDMDSTLIQGEVIDELAGAYGVGEQVASITSAAMRGELDFATSFTRRVALLAGADASLMDAVVRGVRLTDGAERLIRTLKRHGYRTAILSGGFQQVGDRLKQMLGIDHVYANRLEVVDGKLTGRALGTIVDGARKAALLRELVEREGLRMAQAIAVGDGANDLQMLSVAGLGVAFRAKPIVAASAEHAITHFGLDAILYLIGFSERDLRDPERVSDQASLAKL